MLILGLVAFIVTIAGVGYEFYTFTRRMEERLDRVESQIKQVQYYLANQHLQNQNQKGKYR